MSAELPGDATEPDRPIEKGTLFCVSCPYHDPIDGRWTVVGTDDSVHYLCPSCGTELPSRRRPEKTATAPERAVTDGTER